MSTVQFTEATTDTNPTRESTNNSKSVYLTDPTKPYPLVTRSTNFSGIPVGQSPDPNLNYDTVFSNYYKRGGKRKNNRKTTKRKRSRKSRKHKRKSTRRYR